MLFLCVLLFQGCSMNGNRSGTAGQPALPEKAVIDTSLVLETLELYRAKRYESIQEAQAAGIENAHKLVLYGRKMGTLSAANGNLVYLQTLDIADNDLLTLPPELGNLHYLQGFYANLNRLTTFPEQLLSLPVLKSIDLSDNQIAVIPSAIQMMDQLNRLSMDRNHLTRIPPELYELENLSVLELSGNGLESLPDGLEHLRSLKKLDLSRNQLTEIPMGLSAMGSHLKDLYLQGNPIPVEAVEKLANDLPNTSIRF